MNVQKCKKFIKKALTDICNASLETGIFPDGFKPVKVKPLHKKGDKKEIQNSRTIFLLSVFSKILKKKKVMYTTLIVFVAKHNIVTEAQNGFKEGK
jgi:hypothetical protein